MFAIVSASFAQANAGYYNPAHTDETRAIADTNRYPLRDRYGDPYSNPNRNGFDLKDTSIIKRTIEYDPKTKQATWRQKPWEAKKDIIWPLQEGACCI